jgi:hypothetical protein
MLEGFFDYVTGRLREADENTSPVTPLRMTTLT